MSTQPTSTGGGMSEMETTPDEKPIKVFYSILTERFYASQHYEQEGNLTVITGTKYDVTSDIGYFVNKHGIEFIKTETRQ